jgi:hypothetical protein
MPLQIQIPLLTNKLQICELGKLGRDTVQPKSDDDDDDDAQKIGGIYNVEFHDPLTFRLLLKKSIVAVWALQLSLCI